MNRWKIIIEDLAQLDLHVAYEWYEKEKAGLGEELLHASSYDETSRSATLKRFPYEVIYLVNELKSEVHIIAISH